MSSTTTPDDTTQAQIGALVTAQAALRTQATAAAVAMVTTQARGFTGWYDTDLITAWAHRLATQVEAWQRQQAQTTDAYLARVLTLLAGRTVRPVGRVDVTDLRQGVTHAGAYGRAADVYRWQQAQMDTAVRSLLDLNVTPEPFMLTDPVQAAVDRVAAVADMDMQLADRAQTTAVYTDKAEKHTITGYRRVIHPELSAGGSCGLCIAASDRLYGVHEPKPVHSLCKCTTLPVVDGMDPGSALNAGDLGTLYGDAGGTAAAGLKGTRYQVNEHGELGPVLDKQGNVRTDRQARRDTNRPRRPKTDAEKAAQLAKLRDGYVKALPRARELAKSDPKGWGDYLTKIEGRLHGLDQQLAA